MTHISRHIHFIFAIVALCLAFGIASIAHADTGTQLSIAGNGQVIVREAKIVGVSGNTVTATTGWGTSSITWTILTSGSTRFYPSAERGSDTLRAMRVGNSVSFSGVLEPGSRFTVKASSLKDASLLKEAQSIVGTVFSTNSGENTIVISGEHGTTTVAMNSGTILTLDGDTAYIEDDIEGLQVRASGTLNTVRKVLAADRVNLYSHEVPEIPNTGSASDEKPGIFKKIISWFIGTRGALSVR